jgi:hypothetical protein
LGVPKLSFFGPDRRLIEFGFDAGDRDERLFPMNAEATERS